MATESPLPQTISPRPPQTKSLRCAKYMCASGLFLLWGSQFALHALVYNPEGLTDENEGWFFGVGIPSAAAQLGGTFCLFTPMGEMSSPLIGAMSLTTAASITAILGYLAVLADSPTHDLRTYWTCLSYPTIVILTVFAILFLAFGKNNNN